MKFGRFYVFNLSQVFQFHYNGRAGEAYYRATQADPLNFVEQEWLTDEFGAMNAKRILSKVTGKFEKGGAEQSKDKAPVAAVKTEEEGVGTMIIADTEGPEYKREAVGEFKVLEKGDVFFFYRHRVHGTGAHGIQDVARSFIVLRPTSPWTASEVKHSSFVPGATFRLLVVPKKVLPKSGGVKEMAFVEKAQVTLKELQETFLTGFDYMTQTHGATTMPEAKLYAKGVYTITSTHQGSYLAYILTVPKKLGPLQEDFGLRKQGSWLVQSKNPKVFSPPSVSLPESPDYPER